MSESVGLPPYIIPALPPLGGSFPLPPVAQEVSASCLKRRHQNRKSQEKFRQKKEKSLAIIREDNERLRKKLEELEPDNPEWRITSKEVVENTLATFTPAPPALSKAEIESIKQASWKEGWMAAFALTESQINKYYSQGWELGWKAGWKFRYESEAPKTDTTPEGTSASATPKDGIAELPAAPALPPRDFIDFSTSKTVQERLREIKRAKTTQPTSTKQKTDSSLPHLSAPQSMPPSVPPSVPPLLPPQGMEAVMPPITIPTDEGTPYTQSNDVSFPPAIAADLDNQEGGSVVPSGLEEVRDYAFTQEPKASVPVFEVTGDQPHEHEVFKVAPVLQYLQYEENPRHPPTLDNALCSLT